jgi:hypothetical protein
MNKMIIFIFICLCIVFIIVFDNVYVKMGPLDLTGVGKEYISAAIKKIMKDELNIKPSISSSSSGIVEGPCTIEFVLNLRNSQIDEEVEILKDNQMIAKLDVNGDKPGDKKEVKFNQCGYVNLKLYANNYYYNKYFSDLPEYTRIMSDQTIHISKKWAKYVVYIGYENDYNSKQYLIELRGG